MNGEKNYNLLAAAALIISTGLVALTVGDWLLQSDSLPVRAGTLAAGMALAAGSVALMQSRSRRQLRAAQRQFDALCRLDPNDPCSETLGGDIPRLPADNPWSATVDRVRAILLERCRQQRELEHSRAALEIRCRRATSRSEQIKSILSGLSEPILAVDDYDDVVLANRSAEELFHFDCETAETQALDQLVHCQRLVSLLTSTSHRKTAGSRTDEIEICDEQGNSRWYRVTAEKLPAAADGTGDEESTSGVAVSHGTVAVLRDIGNQKAVQKRNAEFVSAVSHEMKTPLAGIKAYVELLVDGDAEDEETQEEFLTIINSQADRLQRLVDNMLNLARIEAGVVGVSKQTRSLNELLEEAVDVVQPSADAKNIELTSELSPMYLGVLADRDMLLQTAINLLSNAIKYTPQGGKVTLRSRLEDDLVRFEVQDTGVGLSEEDCQRVFEKFYRVKKDKRMASGTGLGLPLAKHIVEDVHGGRLTVESTLGEGSTFIATMPGAGKLT